MKVIFDKDFLEKSEPNRFTVNRTRFTKISDRDKLDIRDYDWMEFIFTLICHFPFLYSFKHKLWIFRL